MAETVTIEGKQYLKRNPLGVLGLSFITIGIYFFVWYYKINKEIKTFEKDETISPGRSTWAVTLGALVIIPAIIAYYNTAKHVQTMEQHVGVQQTLEPALVVVLIFVFSIGNGIYIQEHLNRVWDKAAGTQAPVAPPIPPPPPAMPPA
jgi:membrane protease YdiL (CAAX protease family)